MHPRRIAVHVPDGNNEFVALSYEQLQERVDRLRDALARSGLAFGDRIGILSHNSPQFLELIFASASLGLIVVPLNVRLTVPEWQYQLNDSGARLLILGPEFAGRKGELLRQTDVERTVVLSDDTFRPAADAFVAADTLSPTTHALLAAEWQEQAADPGAAEVVEAENARARRNAGGDLGDRTGADTEPGARVTLHDPLLICYTSGTTGAPKGAVITHGNQLANALNATMTLDIRADDTMITLLPMFHTGGIGLFTLPTLYAGGTVVLPRQFQSGEALALIERFGVTGVFAVPTIHQALIDDPAFDKTDLRTVRWFYSGGAPCPLELIKRFRSRGFLFGQGYGLTETSPTHFLLVPEDFERKLGTVGRPALHAEARIVDEDGQELPAGEVGEIVVAGPNVFKQYWNRPDETEESFKDGWFYTGDLGRADEEGFVTLVGRRKELIISGGENIYPLEVEQVLESHPAVAEAAVVGLPDARWGETPHAAIELHAEGAASLAISAEALTAWCEERLARYKVPKTIHFEERLPRNAAGKVLKPRLAERLAERLGSESAAERLGSESAAERLRSAGAGEQSQ